MAMRRGFLAFALANVFILSLTAQVDAQYQAWMRAMQPSMMAIRDAQDNSRAAEAATKMAETFLLTTPDGLIEKAFRMASTGQV